MVNNKISKSGKKLFKSVTALVLVVAILFSSFMFENPSINAETSLPDLSVPITQSAGAGGGVKLDFDMVDSENLLVNGDFEQGESLWTTKTRFNIVTDEVNGGTKAARIDGSDLYHEKQSVTPGAKYTFEAYGKVAGGNDKAWISFAIDKTEGKAEEVYLEFTENSYTKKSVTFDAPSNASKMYAYMWKEPKPTYLYGDDLKLTKKVVKKEGNQYFYSDNRVRAEQVPQLGETRPQEYSKVLVSGKELACNNGEYVNVVEVDKSDKVITHKSIKITQSSSTKTVAEINNINISGSSIIATLDIAPSTEPTEADFVAAYTSDLNPTAVPLSFTSFKYTADKNTVELAFEPIAQKSLPQVINVSLKYGNNTIKASPFTVKASGEEVTTAKITSISAINGKLEILLDKEPTAEPKAEEFSAVYTSDIDVQSVALPMNNFQYDKVNKKVSFNFDPIIKITKQNITVKVTYREEETAALPFAASSAKMDVWTATSYDNIFKDALKSETSTTGISISCVRNEFESAQILVRGEKAFNISGVTISAIKSGENIIESSCFKYNFVEYVNLKNNSNGQDATTVLRTAPGYFPDALSNETSVQVEGNSTQPIWVRFFIPKGVPAGTYTASITVSTSAGEYMIPVTIKVYDVTIPDSKDAKFSFSFWSNLSATWDCQDDKDGVSVLYGYERYSTEWWKLMDSVAQLMKDNRSNDLYINTTSLLLDGGTSIKDGKFAFKWDKFDEYIQFFMDKGVVKRLEGMAILMCVYGKDYKTFALRENSTTHKMEKATVEYNTPESKAYLEQYIPELGKHLKEKGWDKIWMQHVGDEPMDIEAQTSKWGAVRTMLREANPNIRCGDPYDNTGITSTMIKLDPDIFFPILSVHEAQIPIYDNLKTQGKEVFMYTCLNPQGEWLNRLVDKPVWQMRTIGWLSYKRNITGHLHWGLNEWLKYDTKIYNEIPSQGWKGDNFTIYPDIDFTAQSDGTIITSTPRRPMVKSSIRYEAVRDACEDYEIFKILEQRDMEQAKSISGSIVTDGDTYSKDKNEMIRQRERLIKEASIKPVSTVISQQVGENNGNVKLVFDPLTDGHKLYYDKANINIDSTLNADLAGMDKPLSYDTALVSSEEIKRDNNTYVNVIEVDAGGKVVSYCSLKVNASKVAMASTVSLTKEIKQEKAAVAGKVKLNFDAVTGENAIKNADFELGTQDWSKIGAFTISDTAGRNGSKAAQVGFGEGGSEQKKDGLIPGATYIFDAWGKVSKTGEKGWVSLYLGSAKKDLEFAATDYENKKVEIQVPINFDSTAQIFTWKNGTNYGGLNDAYFFADDIKLTSINVELGKGHVYYYSAETIRAKDIEVEAKRPLLYNKLLANGDEITRNKGEYINIIEVDSNGKVVALKSIMVNTLPIANISEVTVATEVGKAPVLPKEVTVTYSDSTTGSAIVIWDAIDASKYSQKGSLVVKGTVQGTDMKAYATVKVNEKPHVIVPGGSTTPTTVPALTIVTEVKDLDGTTVVKSTAKQPVTVTGNSASATVTAEDANKLISDTTKAIEVAIAKGEKVESIKPVIEIKSTVTAGIAITKSEIGLPKAAIEKVAKIVNADLKLSTQVAEIVFDTKAMETISKKATSDVKFIAEVLTTDKVLGRISADKKDEVKAIIVNRPVYNFTVSSANVNISDFEGGNAIITIPYTLKDGEKAENIVVYYVDAKGNLQVVNGKYNEATKCVEMKLSHFSTYVVGYNAVVFKDVDSKAWYAKAAGFVSARKITSGVGNDIFAPNMAITRGQFIKMLCTAYGLKNNGTEIENFADAGDTWYTESLLIAKQQGISTGVGDNKFAPEKEITRQEMFTIIHKTLKKLGQLPSGNGTKFDKFNDYASVNSWAVEAMNYFTQNGIFTGSDGNINPKTTATRAEMAQLLYNLLK